MKFSLLVHNQVLFIRLYGCFNHQTAQKLLKLLRRGRIHGYTQVTFDLVQVSSIDGSGLGILFLVAHRLKKLGGETFVLNPNPQCATRCSGRIYPACYTSFLITYNPEVLPNLP